MRPGMSGEHCPTLDCAIREKTQTDVIKFTDSLCNVIAFNDTTNRSPDSKK